MSLGVALRGEVGDIVVGLAVVGPLFALVAIQPDLGTALVLAFSLFLALLLSGVSSRWLAPAARAASTSWLRAWKSS